MRILGLLALFSILAPSVAGAGGCGGKNDGVNVVQHIFDAADLDQDGLLTQSEYEEAGLESFGVTFDESDLDADGETSTDEYLELYRMHHPAAGGTEV